MNAKRVVLMALIVAFTCFLASADGDTGYITKRVTDSTLLNEVQTVTVTAGNDTDSFTLTLADGGPQTTGALDWDCTAAEMQAALVALTNIGAGNAVVTESGGVYTVAFQGTLASTALAQLTSTPTGCTVTHATTQQGGLQQLIATGRVVLHSITFGKRPTTGGDITIYDGLDNTGTVKSVFSVSSLAIVSGGGLMTPGTIGPLDWEFRTGLFVDIGAMATFSFVVAYE